MNRSACSLAACAFLVLVASPAAAQDRASSLSPESIRVQAKAAAEQAQFDERIQRATARAAKSICEAGCTGEMKARTQPTDPFATLPDTDDVAAAALPTVESE